MPVVAEEADLAQSRPETQSTRPKGPPNRTRMGPLRIRPGRAYVGQSPEESTLEWGRFRAVLFALNCVITIFMAKRDPRKAVPDGQSHPDALYPSYP